MVYGSAGIVWLICSWIEAILSSESYLGEGGWRRHLNALYVVRSWRGSVIVLLGVSAELRSSGVINVIGIGGGFGLIPRDVETASI